MFRHMARVCQGSYNVMHDVGHLVEVLWWHCVGAPEGIRVQRNYDVTPRDHIKFKQRLR